MASKERYTIPSSSNARRRKPIILIVTISIALLVIIATCLLIFKPFQHNSATSSPHDDTSQEHTDSPSVKSDSHSQSDPTKTESGNDALIDEKTPAKYEGSGASADSITGVVTYASPSSTNFTIRVSIDQYLTEGVCELTLTGPTTYTETTPVISEASTSTCQGFDIPLSTLPSGAYDIRINITSGSLAGTLTWKGTI